MPAATATLSTQPLGRGSRDIGFAVGVAAILVMLFLPMPAFLIDVGLAFSISLSFLILMVALWIARPLDFSAFPTVLLIATLLRLSLNVATTRLILSRGQEGYNAAGHVVGGFSKFVMSGDFVIGVIVFVILITVNFLVITKGATRIAEVGARFTERKNQLLRDLLVAQRGCASPEARQALAAETRALRGVLAENQRLLAVHIEAVKEVSAIIVDSIRQADSDGTYSRYA